MVKLTQKGGNAALNVILWIFAIAGLVAIVYLIIVYATTATQRAKRNNAVANAFPPNTFMETSGLKCPDYWMSVASDSGKNVCRNAYGLKLKEGCKNINEFKKIDSKTWVNSEDRSKIAGIKERCNWLKQCGGVWQGVQNYC